MKYADKGHRHCEFICMYSIPTKTHKMFENKEFFSKNTISEKPRNKAIEKKTNFVQDWGAKKLRRM